MIYIKVNRFLFIVFFTLSLCIDAQSNYVRKTNLPHIYIETFGKVGVTSKTQYVYATMFYVDENDAVTRYDSMQIRGRGNSTWSLSKKPYRIKFAQKEKFLGKGYANAKKWTLMANAGDKTLMRNAITSLMGDFLGLKNNPAHRFVDVTLNGNFLGNYQISDQVEVRPHRVNITEQEYPLSEGADISGGYLLEVDGFKDGNCFTTNNYSVPVRIHYPDDEEISNEQNSYIRNYINQFEDVLKSSDFTDAEKGYRALVDSTSLVNWFLVTEISGNIDGYYSTYFYKDQNDPLLYWGPIWDYDIAYGNDSRQGDTSLKLMTDTGYGQTKNWINRMWEDPWFGTLVNRNFTEAVDAGLEHYMCNKIDSISLLLDESQTLNYNKWGIKTRMYHECVLYSSYDQYITDLKSYINKHLAYLATAFADKKPAEPTPPFAPDNYWYRITNSKSTNALDTYDKNGVPGDLVCCWQNLEDYDDQLWKIIPVGDNYIIVNKKGDLALNDPTPGQATATTNLGTQLNVAAADLTDSRQLWTITPQGTAGYYNLTNVYTQHTANLSGGSSENGAKVISYTTDSRNSTSGNRLWYIIPDTEIEPAPSDISDIEPDEYALGYNPQSKVLHFGSETPELLTFDVRVYSASGSLVKAFKANEQCSLEGLPSAIYIIRWKAGGKVRSAKVSI